MKTLLICCCLLFAIASHGEIALLKRYPTTLASGDTAPDHARRWEFTGADMFHLSEFHFAAGSDVEVKTGRADLGIGHCGDGAVWAVVIPKVDGMLIRGGTNQENIASIWLRFHPKEISQLFPPATVLSNSESDALFQMRRIANVKMHSSWQSGGRAMIPELNQMTLDVDTKDGPRRFFIVDTAAQTAQYIAAFENRSVKQPPALTAQLAESAFDQVWKAFDQDYAMFVLRPEVDWGKLREDYRPRALACKSTDEFAGVCAEMLSHLRDLHVWMTLAGANVPVFNRPRSANANPNAFKTILGDLRAAGRSVRWAVTTNQIGYIAIFGWSDWRIPQQVGEALEQMRNTRGLIVDVRLNGGGSEPLAAKVAGRFLKTNSFMPTASFAMAPATRISLRNTNARSNHAVRGDTIVPCCF